MRPETTHEEIQELLGAYALDAVEADERETIEEHLPTCPRCRSEVEEHLETAALLAAGGAPAPDGIWDRISESLEPADLSRYRERRRPVSRWLTSAVAAAALAAAFVVGAEVTGQRQRIEEVAESADDATLVRVATAALLDPDARRVTLEGRGRVEAVVLPDGTGYLVQDSLRPLVERRTYQLWAMNGSTPISAGVLGPDPGVTAFRVDPRVDALAITEEPAGGVAEPTSDPLVVGEVPALA